jgi:hypothetical protein
MGRTQLAQCHAHEMGLDSTYSIQCRFLVHMAINLRVLYNVRNLSITPATISISKRILLHEIRCVPFIFYELYPVAAHTHNGCFGKTLNVKYVICSPQNK